MRTNTKYSQLSESEKALSHDMMQREMKDFDFKHQIRLLFLLAWNDFKEDKFEYDGPTFVKSRYKSRWELASFIHDWRNENGYVGKEVDEEFFSIMITLNYSMDLIIERWFFTRFTFINVFRHRILRTLKTENPTNIYLLTKLYIS